MKRKTKNNLDAEEKQLKIETAGIDKEVLDILKNEDLLATLSDDKLVKRFILNCFCEMLSEFNKLENEIKGLSNVLTMCSADKISRYLKEVENGIESETARQEVAQKVAEGHKKKK